MATVVGVAQRAQYPTPCYGKHYESYRLDPTPCQAGVVAVTPRNSWE